MPKNSFLKAVFSGPKFSLSPIEKTNKGTVRIGEIVPVYKTMLMGREKIELELGHLVRFAPTVVPVMEGYEVNFDAFCVPVSALGYAQRKERDIMDFHNLALNDGEVYNPLCYDLGSPNAKLVWNNNSAMINNLLRVGSLGDYLNFPSFKRFRDFVRKWIYQTPLFEGNMSERYMDSPDYPFDVDASDVADFVARAFLNYTPYLLSEETSMITVDGTGRGLGIRDYIGTVPFPGQIASLDNYVNAKFSDFQDDSIVGDFYGLGQVDNTVLGVYSGVRSFLGYVLDNYPLVASYYGWEQETGMSPTSFFNHLYYLKESGYVNFNYLDKLFELYQVDAQSAFDSYFEYVMQILLYNGNLTLMGVAENDRFEDRHLPDIRKPFDFTYLAAYWKIISDWYINTNIDGDPNEFFINHCGGILDPENYKVDCKPFYRRWANDPFTSAVPSSKVTNVSIPVDGTIPDLREANAYQKLVDILRNTGNRLRDVMYGIRGYRPSADSTDMSEPLGSLHSFVGIQSVLQTSATTEKSPLASYSGIGTDSSRGDFRKILKVVNSNEATPVVVMVLMSITQRASYFQGMPRYFSKRRSIYDFAIPQLANIGEQEIMKEELFFDYGVDPETYGNEIFGFNRRYYDWFFEDNEVHGNMRDSEDFWHGAREFDTKPALNSQFIGIDSSRDSLSRIFANVSPSSMPIYYNVYFGGNKVVALPRYIQYDL